ncbi:hypothetical protein [Geobacillus thermodenitrificans]|uniref:hypothetical protein n=1 Tax=Geobacillus thermodenitrificans TaxID=33940 RepID=UPI00374287D6
MAGVLTPGRFMAREESSHDSVVRVRLPHQEYASPPFLIHLASTESLLALLLHGRGLTVHPPNAFLRQLLCPPFLWIRSACCLISLLMITINSIKVQNHTDCYFDNIYWLVPWLYFLLFSQSPWLESMCQQTIHLVGAFARLAHSGHLHKSVFVCFLLVEQAGGEQDIV